MLRPRPLAAAFLALFGGAAAGALVMVWLGRDVFDSGPAGPDAVVRDLVARPVISDAAVEQHRNENYRSLQSIPGIFELPSAFARSEALYALAGRSDAAAVQGHVFAADRIADDVERDHALNILFFRLAELDPPSALALARTEYFRATPSLEYTVWSTWARLDFEGALFAAKTQPSSETRNTAAQALYAAFGFMGNDVTGRIEAELGIGPDRSQRARYLYRLADRSPAAAIDYIDAMTPGTEKQWNVNWIAYYLSLKEAEGALAHARHFDEARYREQYENVIRAEAAREDPVSIIEAHLAATGEDAWSPELSSAVAALAEDDPALLLPYIDRAISRDVRQVIALAYIEALAATDPAGAIQWARETDEAGGPYGHNLLMSALLRAAAADPHAAVAELGKLPRADLQEGFVHSVFGQVAQKDPHLALSLLGEIDDPQSRDHAKQSIVTQWMNADPDAAIAWLDSLDAGEASNLIGDGGMMMLTHRDPELAMRLLPRVRKEQQVYWRANIAQQLASTGSAAEAMAFVQRFENEPGYAELQANVIAGLATHDAAGARQLADQLTDTASRDAAYAQIIGQQAQYDPREAAAMLTAIADENQRAFAATNVAYAWFNQDAEAAMRWLGAQPPGLVRDRIVLGAVHNASDTGPELLRLVDDMSDPELRGEAKVAIVYRRMHTDPDAARQLLDDGDIPEHLRRDAETNLKRMGY